MFVAKIFEAIMLICFGCAWPASIYKSYKSRTSLGKSVWFMYVIELGYISGMIFQYLISDGFCLIFILFLINFSMVAIDIGLYYRNSHLDHERSK